MQLNFRSRGSGAPLIILHGLFGSLDNWETISRRLAESWRVWTVDLRNHGASPHAAETSYDLMARDLIDLMDAQGISQAHVMGHSLGGKTAMRMALDFPSRVTKLIIIDIAPKSYPPWHRPIIDAMKSLELGSFTRRSEVDAALAESIPDAPMRQFLVKNIAQTESGRLRWKLNLDSLDQCYESLTTEIRAARNGPFTGAALFLLGELSNYVAPENYGAIRELFTRAQLVTIPKAGHWVHAEAPEEFLNAVSNFLC